MRDNQTPTANPEHRQNIVLIGMPGVGKSTLGVLLAKALGYDFLDTDLLIQRRAGQTLAAYLKNHDYRALRQLEAEVIQSLNCGATVIATGGSAVHSTDAMTHLRGSGLVVYLRCPIETLSARIASMADRGIAAPPQQTLAQIQAERSPLYEAFADITLDLADTSSATALTALLAVLPDFA